MPNLFKNSSGYRWWPDADAVNAPEGALLRADNMVPDPENIMALRAGSLALYSGLEDRVHSLYFMNINGADYLFAGAEDFVYRNGVNFGEEFDGAGDIAFGDDAYQMFCARGKTNKKFDGSNFHNWSIKAPQFPAALAAVPAITTEVASFDSTESPAFVINEGTAAFITGHSGVANGAMQLTPDLGTGRATASKKFASDQNLLNILGSQGGDTDLFDVFVWLQEPRKVDKITFMFGLGTGADPYVDDYYYFDFPIRDAATVDIKDAKSTAATAYSLYAEKVQQVLTPNEITNVKTPEQVVAILRRLGRHAGARSRERKDSQEASPAWTHLSVTRGQFNRVGGTALRDWKTVRGFKVVYSCVPNSTEVAAFDSAIWAGGGNRSLTGRYQLGYRFVRNFNDQYFELSPISPISSLIDLTQQALQATIPAAALAARDPQVNQIWVYINGGFLDTYYRVAILPAFVQQGMTIDELTNPAGSNFNTKSERTRLTSWGFTKITGGDATQNDLVFTIRMSELEAMIENETLEPGASGAPDNIVAIAGPWNGRMYVVTEEGRVYPSSQTSPSTFSLYHHLDFRRYGDPLWAVQTNGGIYVGMTKDVVRIAGTGDESDDKISADLFGEPLQVGNPPIDQSVYTDGNAVLYRSADGLMLLTGTALTPVNQSGTGLLWRGQGRHGVNALDIANGRFRMAVDNQVLYMLAPEGFIFSPPTVASEDVLWLELTGFESSGSSLIKTAATGFNNTHAVSSKRLESGNGYVEAEFPTGGSVETWGIGLKTLVDSGGDPLMSRAIELGNQRAVIVEKVNESVANIIQLGAHTDTNKYRVGVVDGVVKYYVNGTLVYTSLLPTPDYPLVIDALIEENGGELGPVTIQGNWQLLTKSTDAIWRYYFNKQQWARTTYPVRMLSILRAPNGAILVGCEDGTIRELEFGVQDSAALPENGGTPPMADIGVRILTPIDHGGDPLARKDCLDLQIHADTGGRTGTVAVFKDGATSAAQESDFSSFGPGIFRANALDVGVFQKAQIRITGAFNRFVLHAFNLLYRNRVQQVMVLDTGTLSPSGPSRMVWFKEVEIDCISPANLEMDIYLNDVLKDTVTITVTPNKRAAYRTEVPKGCKASAPRLVFRTTNADATGDVGFEPYRVRIKERGTGTATENGFRPVWPVGEAP
jgi:hypothetical protein